MGIKQLIITSLFLPFGLIFCFQLERINLSHMIPQLARQIGQAVGTLPCANKNAGMVALPSVQHGIVQTPPNFLSVPSNFVHLNNAAVSPYPKTNLNSLAALYARNLLRNQNTMATSLYEPKKHMTAAILGTQVQLQSPYSVPSRPRSLSPLIAQQTLPRINMVLATPSSVPNVRYGLGAVDIPISSSLFTAPNAVLYAALNQATPKSAQEDLKEIRLGEKRYNFHSLFIKDQKEIKPVQEDIEDDYEQENLEDFTTPVNSEDKTQYRKRKFKKVY